MNLAELSKRGRRLLWSQECSVERSTGGPGAKLTPTEIHSNVPCSLVYELSTEEMEKGWLTTTSRPLKIYVDIPLTGEIKEHDTVVVNGENYYVIKSNRWPHSNPVYYELIVDYRRGQ